MLLKASNQFFDINANANNLEIGDKSIFFSKKDLNKNEFFIKINGVEKKVVAARFKDKIDLMVEGKYFSFEVIDDEFSGLAAQNLDQAEIKPPMPGSIVKVLAQMGQKVAEGEPLVIVEAMKMETTLFSPISGTITTLNAKEGQQLSGEELLFKIEKE